MCLGGQTESAKPGNQTHGLTAGRHTSIYNTAQKKNMTFCFDDFDFNPFPTPSIILV